MNPPQILHGNNLDLLRQMPDCSVDSIVTDPPYELGFMGKKWDSTGIAYSVELWSECLRVLKHGGHLLAFSGSRTYHRMVVAIEDAGFEIRDQIMWVYGSGFPKSLDVSKAIDKAAGAERQVVGQKLHSRKGVVVAEERSVVGAGAYGESRMGDVTVPATDAAKQWSGWGTALKPAHEPIVMARKPLGEKTVAENVLKHSTGAINIDASRVASNGESFDGLVGRPIQKLATRRDGETDDEYRARVLESPAQQEALRKLKDMGRFPANFIHDGSDEVLALFPDTKSGTGAIRKNAKGMFGLGGDNQPNVEYNDSGSAARFFYCAKANKAERNAGLEALDEQWKAAAQFRPNHMNKALEGESGNPFGRFQPTKNFHPTVKPVALMRYLVRMVTPPNGTVLDPFTGSGTTLVAAVLEGFNSIGMEMTADYLPIIEGRVAWALAQEPEQPTLF